MSDMAHENVGASTMVQTPNECMLSNKNKDLQEAKNWGTFKAMFQDCFSRSICEDRIPCYWTVLASPANAIFCIYIRTGVPSFGLIDPWIGLACYHGSDLLSSVFVPVCSFDLRPLIFAVI